MPKPEDRRRRRNSPAGGSSRPSEPVEQPDLPLRSKFTTRTNDWWALLPEEPAAVEWTPADWHGLATIVAPLLDQFYRDPSDKLSRELRQLMTSYGLTLGERRRLELPARVEEPEQPGPVAVGDPEGAMGKIIELRRRMDGDDDE